MVYVNSSSKSSGGKATNTGKKVPSPESGPNVDLYDVESEGKTYPTTNPNFVPGQNTWFNPATKQIEPTSKKEVNFDQPNGVVQVTTGGKTYNLSKEEYGGQFVTPQTMALDQSLANQSKQISSDVSMVNQTNQAQTTPGATPINQEMPENEPNLNNKPVGNEVAIGGTPNKTAEIAPQVNQGVSLAQANAGIDAQAVEKLTNIGPVAGTTRKVAAIISTFSDFLPSWLKLGEGKTTEVKKAEAGFTDMNSLLQEEIENAKLGLVDWDVVDSEIELATQSIIDLGAQAHGYGKLNLRYWLDEGKELELQVQREIVTLNQKKMQLNAIKQAQYMGQQNLMDAKQRLGVQ